MKLELYSVWDRKSCVFNSPVGWHNAEQAKRELSMFLDGHRDTVLARFPDDFCLMRVGSWDDHSGTLTPISPAEYICGLRCLLSPDRTDGEANVIPFGSPSSSVPADQAPPSKEAGGADRPV